MIDIYELLRRNQDGTSEYVRSVLDEMNVSYNVDSYGNIYYLDHENSPILSAHMDTVRKEKDFCIGAFLNESEDDKILSGGILGGDDKCGVYIILKVLEIGRKVNFIFSRDEEIGCLGIKALVKPNSVENKEVTEKIKNSLWCLVLDRRGNSDIICEQNDYGTIEFEKALEKISNEGNFGYKGARGLCSDANYICDYISTANLSVGYYNPHSDKEYILKSDLQKALDYTLAIIDGLKEQFVAPEPKPYNYYYNGYRYGYGYDYYGYYNGYNYGKSKSQGKKTKDKDDDDYSYEYPGYDDEFDGYDYSGWSWDDWKNLDHNNSRKACKCEFCQISSVNEPLYEIVLPNGIEKHICEYCLEDLEREVQRVKALIQK